MKRIHIVNISKIIHTYTITRKKHSIIHPANLDKVNNKELTIKLIKIPNTTLYTQIDNTKKIIMNHRDII